MEIKANHGGIESFRYFVGQLVGGLNTAFIGVESDDDVGNARSFFQSIDEFGLSLSATCGDSGHTAADEREGVDGAFTDGDRRFIVDDGAVEQRHGRCGVMDKACVFGDITDSAGGIIIGIMRDGKAINFLIERDIVFGDDILIVARKAARMKVINARL